MSFACELADVDHAVVFHVGEAGVADVGVVCPDNRLRLRAVMLHQALQRVSHVAVADIPRFRAALYHRAVIVLGILDDEGILLGIKRRFAIVPFVRTVRSGGTIA